MHQDFKKNILNEKSSIKEALNLLDILKIKIIFVINTSRVFCGTITDGDIRRGLLRGVTLESKVADLMNKNSISAKNGKSEVELKDLASQNGIKCIPILSNDNILEDIFYLDEDLPKGDIKNAVFIMAGGFGKRLRPLTDNCPKPMLKIAGKPILEIIIEKFIDAGFRRFYISTHFLPEVIKEYFKDGSHMGINIKYLHEEVPLGTGGAISMLPSDEINEPFIMINGDVVTNVNLEKLLDFHTENNSLATVCARQFDQQVPYGVINHDKLNITSITEKPINSYLVNAGIYVLDRDILNFVRKKELIDMPDVIEKAINKKYKVSVFPIHEYWLDVGQKNDFSQADIDYRKYKAKNE